MQISRRGPMARRAAAPPERANFKPPLRVRPAALGGAACREAGGDGDGDGQNPLPGRSSTAPTASGAISFFLLI